MFQTSLHEEYQHASEMGLNETELRKLVSNSFDFSFAELNR